LSHGWQHGSTRSQKQKSTASKFHGVSFDNLLGLFNPDVGRPDHLAPLLGFVGGSKR
jgi:hypothetical protein